MAVSGISRVTGLSATAAQPKGRGCCWVWTSLYSAASNHCDPGRSLTWPPPPHLSHGNDHRTCSVQWLSMRMHERDIFPVRNPKLWEVKPLC